MLGLGSAGSGGQDPPVSVSARGKGLSRANGGAVGCAATAGESGVVKLRG